MVYVPSSVPLQKWPAPEVIDPALAVVPIPVKVCTTTKPSHCLVLESHVGPKLDWIAVHHEGTKWWAKTNDVYEVKNEIG